MGVILLKQFNSITNIFGDLNINLVLFEDIKFFKYEDELKSMQREILRISIQSTPFTHGPNDSFVV